MKKIIVVSALTASSFAMAADLKWNVEGRFDYVSSDVKHEQVTSTNNYEEKRMEAYSNVLRLNAVYTVNETLSGRFRYRFSTAQDNKEAGSTAGTGTNAGTKNRDLSFQNVDFMYLDHKNDWFTARLGKHAQAESIGREFFMSGSDYPVTAVGNSSGSYAQAAASGTTTGYTTSDSLVYNLVKNDADLYRVGASLLFAQIPSSTLTLSVFNPQKTTTYSDGSGNGNNATNTKMGMGIYYNGSFMNKMVQPTLGYTSFGIAGENNAAAPTANNVADATHKVMAVGVKSEVAGFVVDLDWKQYKRGNTAVTSAGTDNSDKSTSIWANVAYTWENLTPFLTYINDKYEQTGLTTAKVNDFKRTAMTVGLMIKPVKDVNFRYHVAYTSDVKKIDLNTAADNKVTANTIAAGIKFDI